MAKTDSEVSDMVGVSLHHDAITGTSVQSTINDYVEQINSASLRNSKVYEQAIGDRIHRMY